MSPRPNILLILADQQSASMMSCAGNRYLETPAMDAIAAGGVRFERAYCSNPVCVPSRFSIVTGRMPGGIRLRFNDCKNVDSIPDHVRETGLGWLLREAGYETAYGGKQHFPLMNAEDLGFEVISRDERDLLPDHCAQFLDRDRDRPFFLAASFVNPHDVCYMAIRDFAGDAQAEKLLSGSETELRELDAALALPEGVGREDFFANVCPPLPPNFEPQEDEPEAVAAMQAERPFKREARAQWSEERWRMHRWAYARLTERVDGQIARLLAALRERGLEENTVVIFTSDHGDMDSAHRMEHKTVLYEEACRVPLLVSAPGAARPGGVESRLVSNGLDIVPTICDYAGAELPGDLRGSSLRPLVEGRDASGWREWLPVESDMGATVVTPNVKYVLYDDGASREQLFDLATDPGEMRNAAGDPEKARTLERMRGLFAEAFPTWPPAKHH